MQWLAALSTTVGLTTGSMTSFTTGTCTTNVSYGNDGNISGVTDSDGNAW